MSQNVFMILYNYREFDYSVVKIMNSLDKAYHYICCQENDEYDKFKLICVTHPKQLIDKIDEDCLNVCYITTNNYNKFDLSKYDNISSYVIISMPVC